MTLTVQYGAKNAGRGAIGAQTPGGSGEWKDLHFIESPEDRDADWLVIYDDPGLKLNTRVPVERRILFVGEPAFIKDYFPHFVNQFGIVVSPMAIKGFRGIWLQQHGALVWFFGPAFDELCSANYDNKQTDLSAVCSSTRKYAVQRQRYEFMTKIKEILGDKLHWYGRGVQDIEMTSDAIIPSRYCIAIENNFVEHSWTEKLSEVYLGQAFPFYSGGPNLGRYFNEDAFEYIDIKDPAYAAKKIEHAIRNHVYEERLPLIKEARQKVLFEYNLFNEVWKIISKHNSRVSAIPRLAKPKTVKRRKAGVRSWGFGLRRRLKRHYEHREHNY
jgi:hypothetical protein